MIAGQEVEQGKTIMETLIKWKGLYRRTKICGYDAKFWDFSEVLNSTSFNKSATVTEKVPFCLQEE